MPAKKRGLIDTAADKRYIGRNKDDVAEDKAKKSDSVEDRPKPHERQDPDHAGIDWDLTQPPHGENRE